LLILLSDGFPQDTDYGSDRRSITYGIRDTMMALREADQAGVLTFCLTVDKAGHDYLREMCEPSRYLVLEDVTSLPTELPKVYQRYIRPAGF
jgi:nitric oxide reductase NorD protein